MCTKHFEEDCFSQGFKRLNANSVPTLGLPGKWDIMLLNFKLWLGLRCYNEVTHFNCKVYFTKDAFEIAERAQARFSLSLSNYLGENLTKCNLKMITFQELKAQL